MISDYDLTQKLYEISGPVIRWRVSTELMDKTPCDTEQLLQTVLAHLEVQQYIKYYTDGAKQGHSYSYSKMIHGAKPELLENTAGKLWTLGIRKGISQIDEFYKPYIDILEQDFYNKNAIRIGYGVYAIAQFLSLLGYAGEEPISSIMQMRLEQVYSFVQQKRYDIYVDVKGYPKLPTSWKRIDKIIDPALTRYGNAEGEPPLPSLYDFLGIVGMMQVGMTKENEMKANAILKYCYDERYQRDIMYKYGILLAPTGNYYSMGWSVHLPGYGQALNKNIEMNKLLLWAEIFSYFSISREFVLFKDLLDFMEGYRNNNGFYCFLKKFIPEGKRGYFVFGKYMGLGENRMQKEACMIESTFRVLRLKKNLGMYS